MTTIRQRYDKVKALVERGATDGEKEAAREAMKRMEEAHPELAESAPIAPKPVVVVYYRVWPSWSGSSATSGNTTSSVSY